MKQKTFALILLATACYFGAFLTASFRDEPENIRPQIDQALQEAIAEDYHKRLFKQGMYRPKPLERKVKGIRIISENGPEDIWFADSLDEQTAHQLVDQYMFARLNPLVPDEFNALFKKELEKIGIDGRTGIVYRHNGVPQYSGNDSAAVRSALYTQTKMLDAKNTVSVQGWVDYDWGMWLEHADKKNLWLSLGCYVILLAFVLLLKKMKGKTKKTEYIENTVRQEDDPDGYNLGRMRLDLKRKSLYIDGAECPITNMDFDLLRMFVEAPEYYLSREDIKQAFWAKEEEVENKINSHITSLRSKIKDLEGYSIERMRGKGYRLAFPA